MLTHKSPSISTIKLTSSKIVDATTSNYDSLKV